MKEKNVLSEILGFFVAFIYLFLMRMDSCRVVNYYENLDYKNIDCISFLSYHKKNILYKICDSKKIKNFLSNYWDELESAWLDRAWGKSFIIKIKTDKIHKIIATMSSKGFVKLDAKIPDRKNFGILIKKKDKVHKITAHVLNGGLIYLPTRAPIKSYKLYKFFKLLEEKLKEIGDK